MEHCVYRLRELEHFHGVHSHYIQTSSSYDNSVFMNNKSKHDDYEQ